MRLGLGDFVEGIRVKAYQPRWIGDVAVPILPPWFLVIAFAFPAAPSNWSCAAFLAGAVLLMMCSRAKSAAMGCAYATVA